MNHTDTAADYVDGTCEASYAEHEAEELARLADEGQLTTAHVAAHAARGVIYAILAARKTLASVIGDTSDAVTELETTLDKLAGAVTAGEPESGK